MTRICIFGAGAIGGYVGARLAMAGEADVSLVARGPHLAAMQQHGLILKQDGETRVLHPEVTDDPRRAGPAGFHHSDPQGACASRVSSRRCSLWSGPHTAILFAQNGIPWWYFYKSGGPFDGHRLQSVDPGGAIWDRIGPERALGCVVWQAAEIEAPGVISHHYGDRMPIGEPSGEKTARVQTLSRLLTAAGIKSQIKPNLRNEIWLKLWGNLSFNPVSVLTQGTLVELASRSGHPPGDQADDGRKPRDVARCWTSPSRSVSTSASTWRRRWAPTAPPCCRMWRREGPRNWMHCLAS